MNKVKVVLLYTRLGQADYLPYNLREAIYFLQAYLDKIPEKYKSEACITAEDDELLISYYRDETEEERQAREYVMKNSSSILEARERKELKRLLEKYGDNIPDPVL